MFWRLTLDVPESFPIEPGYVEARDMKRFQPAPNGMVGTWREPVTGLVMLKPSIQERDWQAGAKSLSDFRTTASCWEATKRSMDLVDGYSNVLAAGADPSGIALSVEAAKIAIQSSAASQDTMEYVMQSSFILGADEGWALNYAFITDELPRKRNWLLVQWDNIWMHFGGDGACRVYWGDREDILATPDLVYEFEIGRPGELANRQGYHTFIPCPPFGLIYYHSLAPPVSASRTSGASGTQARGHLLPLPSRLLRDGSQSIFNPSHIRIGINPYYRHAFTICDITYPASGTYTDQVLAPPTQKPTGATDVVAALTDDNPKFTCAAEMMKPDQSATWATGVDTRYRVKTTLTTTDTKRTPFLFGYGVSIDAVTAVRNTTPVEVDRLFDVEYTWDRKQRFEGSAEFMASSAAIRAILQRGDATFLLENSADGVTWATVERGMATEFVGEIVDDNWGTWFRGSCVLRGMWCRLGETHCTDRSAGDGMTVHQAIDQRLRGMGLPALTSWPAALDRRKIPPAPDDKGWRFGPRESDDGVKLIDALLLMARGQWTEYVMPWDRDAAAFKVVQRARSTAAPWYLIHFRDGADPRNHTGLVPSAAARVLGYCNDPKLKIERPEANIVRVVGCQGKRISGSGLSGNMGAEYTAVDGIAKNVASISDPTSPDYLGRCIPVTRTVDGVSDKAELARFARMILDRAGHRCATCDGVEVPEYVDGMLPDEYAVFVASDGSTMELLWVTRVTVKVKPGSQPYGWQESTFLDLDGIWEGELQ